MTPYKALETVLSEYVGLGGMVRYEDLAEQAGVGVAVIRRLGRHGDNYKTDAEFFIATLEALPRQAQARYWFLRGHRPPKRIKGAPVPLKRALAAITALAARMAAAMAKDRPCHRDEAELHQTHIPAAVAELSRVTLR